MDPHIDQVSKGQTQCFLHCNCTGPGDAVLTSAARHESHAAWILKAFDNTRYGPLCLRSMPLAPANTLPSDSIQGSLRTINSSAVNDVCQPHAFAPECSCRRLHTVTVTDIHLQKAELSPAIRQALQCLGRFGFPVRGHNSGSLGQQLPHKFQANTFGVANKWQAIG